MKKLLALFIILDLIFVGIVIKISSEKQRNVASESANNSELTEGQKQKLEIIQSLHFNKNEEAIILQTNMLQALCASYSLVELKFKAVNMAFSGQEPLVTHAFSCAEIIKNNDLEKLSTNLTDFKTLNKTKEYRYNLSLLKSKSLYSDEDMPSEWRLFEISISGENSFNISEAELNKILGDSSFYFDIK